MNSPIKRSVVTLREEARMACISMLEDLKNDDRSVKIDNSKLVSYIMCEYFEKYFNKNKAKLREAFQDSKRKIINDLPHLSPEQVEELSKFLSKIK